MAVADTDVNIFDDTENSGNNGGGGGGTTDVTIFSSRNTITTEEVSPGTWDVNVANEDALRYIIHNFKEFMDAAVDIRDNQYSRGRSCVMQLVKDIDMTSPTATDETTYAGLIDRTNKKYNFGGFFKYTTILCDGTRRTLQLTYPDNGNLDTWTFGAEWVRFTNVSVGGGITSYGSFPGHGSPSVSAVSFSRYLLESTGNLNYALDKCEITCCGMPDNTFNPFIKEGSGDNRNAWGIYHSRYVFDNCLFWHGADPHGGIWANCNAPIVITSNYNSTYERSIRIKQLSKSISNTTAETGVPNFQIRTDNASVPTNSWSSHKWQITADGTALVSCQAGNQYLVLKTRLAVNDLYIQDQSDLQPEGATNTYNWVSLSELISPYSLLQNRGINGLINFHDKKLMSIPTSDRYTEFENYAYLFASYEIYDLIFSTIPISQMIPGSTKVYSDEACTIEYATVYATSGDVVVVLEIEGEIKQYYSIGKTPTYIATTKAIIDALNSPMLTHLDADKLGYWKGTTANLPAVGSREANKLYITTDY